MSPPPSSLGVLIRRIAAVDGQVVLYADGATAAGRCPACAAPSHVIHDRYVRRPLDLPWRGHPVRLVLTVRRFRCLNQGCARTTFAEDFGPGLGPRMRRTTTATALVLQFALTAGGEAGARLAHASGLPISPDTLLRLLRATATATTAAPRVLGVDDFALRKGRTYATLLVDMATHRPVDVLKGRDAAVLTAWLRDHPGVGIIVRDRSEAYAQGAREGAPAAQQVADRFHLIKNVSDALNDLLNTRRRRIEIMTVASDEPAIPPPIRTERAPSPSAQRQTAKRAARVARWEQVRALDAAGMSLRRIAEEAGIDRKTARRLLATPEPPRNQIVHPRPGGLTSPTLAPFVTYLQDRWQQGCHNVSRLYRELAAQGYGGSRSLLAQSVQAWRPPRPPPVVRTRRRPRSVRWLCLRPPDQLTVPEQAALAQMLVADADLARGYDLLQRFRRLMTDRDAAALAPWLQDARMSGLPSFAGVANGIASDRAAVEAALTTPWSNGLVEGHVHRVKLIKRQGYGRAKLDLLRRRVLAA